MTVCVCTFTGEGKTSWCPRHNCAKTVHWHLLCQTQPAYFELWEQGRGPGQNLAQPRNPAEHIPCLHMAAEVRREQCPTCQGHVLVKVFTCPLHDECTLAKELPGIACCATCADYQTTAVSMDLVAEPHSQSDSTIS